VTIDPRSGALDRLCVTSAEHGSGLASALMDEGKRRSPRAVELEVNEANPRARRFCDREGFRIVGQGVSPHSGLPTLKMRWRAKDSGGALFAAPVCHRRRSRVSP
jgi:putative acetyltransferase